MDVGQRRRHEPGTPSLGRALLAVLAALLLVSGPAAAAAPEGEEDAPSVEWQAAINGRPVTEIDSNDPVRLDPQEGATLTLDLTNTSQQEVTVRSVRLDGKVMGLTMYNFTTRIDLVMPPNSQTTRTIDIDLIDLSGQATGLIPSRLLLLDDERNVLQEQSFPADVRGSANSVYGVFGMAVLGITLVLLGTLLLAIRRTQLPENRWRRAMRFVPAGLGLGFVLTFTLSATRQLAPSAGSWTTVVLLCAAGAMAIGYFLPIGVADDQDASDDHGDTDDDTDDDGEDGGQDGGEEDDTATLESVGAEHASDGATSAGVRADGHWWTSGDQGPAAADQPATPEDDW
ncbi:hypothetical protein [Ornithinicoccus hortensis]|uniref:Uncharacterized protein n=1 Tax=Ornithinicoccus hortensis TaxID=82346 RepID=A0A542YV77_9MICO|nr:hypothetical protein [Ornithinicoccus hortensis]TQL51864.1 hypothetical protein FB467_3031 [Ornithinicoccus hortensis]